MSTTGRIPQEAYGVFCGAIDDVTAQRVAHWLSQLTQGGVQHLHLLFQSSGGLIGDGVFLHRLFCELPIGLSVYNAGQVISASVTSYLGAERRVTSPHATFMIHRTKSGPQLFTSSQLASASQNLDWDDERTKKLIKERATKIPDELWDRFDRADDVFMSGRDALDYGIATELGEFTPPKGMQLLDFVSPF